MNVYKSSLIGDESEEDLRSGFQAILDLFIDSAINMCLSPSNALLFRSIYQGISYAHTCASGGFEDYAYNQL